MRHGVVVQLERRECVGYRGITLTDTGMAAGIFTNTVTVNNTAQTVFAGAMSGAAPVDPLIVVNKNIVEGLATVLEGGAPQATTISQLGAT